MKRSASLSLAALVLAAACGENGDVTPPTAAIPSVPSRTLDGGQDGNGNNTAQDVHGDIKPSNLTPASSTTYTTTAQGGQTSGDITLSWNPPGSSRTSVTSFTGYEIRITCVGTGCSAAVPNDPHAGTTFNMGKLGAGVYSVRVRGRGTTTGSNGKTDHHASRFVETTITVNDPSQPPPPSAVDQTITVTQPVGFTGLTYGDPHYDIAGWVSVTTSKSEVAGLDPQFTSLTASVCSMSGTEVVNLAAGECKIEVSQPGSSTTPKTHNAATSQVITIAIAKAVATVTAVGGKFTYSGSAHTGAGTATGVSGVPLTPVVVTYKLGETALQSAPVNAGSYTVVASFAGDQNYNAASNSATIEIEKAKLTVAAVASPSTKTYDGQPAAHSVTYTGFVGTESESVLTGPLALNVTNAPGNTNTYPGAGAYFLVPSGLSSANYDISYTNAAVTINKAPATIDLSNLVQAYAANTPRKVTVTTTPRDLATTVTYSLNGATPTTTEPTAVGVHSVKATITNPNYVGSESGYLVIYDPSAGFVTGGGWIKYSAGSCTMAACGGAAGTADFGFVSKYQKGATIPTGNTRFEFHAGTLNFASSAYEWLVVSGTRAQFKGVGKINGQGDYGFLLTAVDGAPDRFRIKIWDRAAGGTEENTVFDNGADAALDKINGGGSIVIHSK